MSKRAGMGVGAFLLALGLVFTPVRAQAQPAPAAAKSAAEVMRLERLSGALDERIAQLRDLLAKVAAQTQEVVGRLEPLAAESRQARELLERLARLDQEAQAKEKALAALLAGAPPDLAGRLATLEEGLGQARRALDGLGRDMAGLKEQAAAPKVPVGEPASTQLASQVKALGDQVRALAEETPRLRQGSETRQADLVSRLETWLWLLWGLGGLCLGLGVAWLLTWSRVRGLGGELADLRARTKSALVKLRQEAR